MNPLEAGFFLRLASAKKRFSNFDFMYAIIAPPMHQDVLIQFTVRYAETDSMGVANHARYLDWFSEGRIALLKQAGLSYAAWEHDGLYLPVIEAKTSYRLAARLEEQLSLKTVLLSCKPRIMEFEYFLFRNQELLATGFTRHCYMRNGRAVRLDEQLLRILGTSA